MAHDYVAAYEKTGSFAKAAKLLRLGSRSAASSGYYRQIKNQEQSKALNKLGVKICDAESAVMDGLDMRGTSRYYKLEDGGLWVKTDKEKEDAAEYIKSVADTLMEGIAPRDPIPLNADRFYDENLCNVFPIADYHMGMYSSEAETGTHWNLEYAERLIKDWFSHACANAPKAEQAVIMNLGDMCHIDGNMPYTTSRKHAVDTSGRFHEIRDAIVRSFDFMLSEALKTHKNVHVIYMRGNHDDHVSGLIRDMIARAYMNNDRITFDRTEKRYHAFRWGQTALFGHHGDKRTLKAQAETFVSLFSEIYGNTDYRYGFTGHRHHEERGREHSINMRQFTTLAPLDNYAAELGYSMDRRAGSLTYHKKYGYFDEKSYTPEMFI